MAKPKIISAVGTASGRATVSGVITVQVHTPLPENHPFYALVGRVASEWSHLEHILDLVIYDFVTSRFGASVPANVLACVTSQILGVAPRCRAIQSLAKHCRLSKTKILDPFKKLMGKSFTVGELRNRFVHDPWYMDIDTRAAAQFRAMPHSDPSYGYKEITKEEAEKTIKEIKKLQDWASDLRGEVRAELQASAEKQT
jgi:hypothetical protein